MTTLEFFGTLSQARWPAAFTTLFISIVEKIGYYHYPMDRECSENDLKAGLRSVEMACQQIRYLLDNPKQPVDMEREWE